LSTSYEFLARSLRPLPKKSVQQGLSRVVLFFNKKAWGDLRDQLQKSLPGLRLIGRPIGHGAEELAQGSLTKLEAKSSTSLFYKLTLLLGSEEVVLLIPKSLLSSLVRETKDRDEVYQIYLILRTLNDIKSNLSYELKLRSFRETSSSLKADTKKTIFELGVGYSLPLDSERAEKSSSESVFKITGLLPHRLASTCPSFRELSQLSLGLQRALKTKANLDIPMRVKSFSNLELREGELLRVPSADEVGASRHTLRVNAQICSFSFIKTNVREVS